MFRSFVELYIFTTNLTRWFFEEAKDAQVLTPHCVFGWMLQVSMHPRYISGCFHSLELLAVIAMFVTSKKQPLVTLSGWLRKTMMGLFRQDLFFYSLPFSQIIQGTKKPLELSSTFLRVCPVQSKLNWYQNTNDCLVGVWSPGVVLFSFTIVWFVVDVLKETVRGWDTEMSVSRVAICWAWQFLFPL